MTPPKKLTQLRVLDKTLSGFDGVKKAPVPPKGWIRQIRDALAMEGRQLAKRMGVTGGRVTRMEKDEVAGAVTLRTMQHAAEAMGCEFVYAIVPATGDRLEDLVRKRAMDLAQEKLKGQSLSKSDKERALRDMVEDLIRELPRDLWEP